MIQGRSDFLQGAEAARLPATDQEDLLDRVHWVEPLEKFARATNLAVALVDPWSRQIGECLNPQPIWKLLRSGRTVRLGECPFCLARKDPCCSVALALEKGGPDFSTDQAGLVHFAVPLVLSGYQLGALVAGQVFDQHPEQLPLDQVAKRLGLSPLEVWKVARLQAPIRRATLESYAELLGTLGRTALETRYWSVREAERLREMTGLRDQLQDRTRQLLEADQRKNNFLAMLGHELRNPLGVIASSLGLLDRIGSQEEPEVRVRETATRHCHHLRRLVDDLLDVARLTRGSITLDRQPVEVVQVIEEAVQASRAVIEERRHRLSISQPAEPVWLEGDPTRLTQILTNLLNNAAKYTDPGGQIWVSAERQGADLLLKVRDTGIGMDSQLLSRVFEIFCQGDASLARERGGLGMGLAVVKKLAELHGGSVQASSAGPGRGSELVVRLPILIAPPAARAAASISTDLGRRSRRILVVEDNQDQAALMSKLLEIQGHRVVVAHDGPAAIEAAHLHAPEVVLVDIGLPGMSGYELARELRNQPGLGEVVLIALTGYGQEEDRRRSAAAGFDQHLLKPVDFPHLEELIANS